MALPSCLLVEDDAQVARAIRRVAKSYVQPEVASSVAEALSWLSGGRSFDGLITDIGLPDGSGLSVLERFRAMSPKAPALVVTGLLEPALLNRVHVLGGRFACKPDVFGPVRNFCTLLLSGTGGRHQPLETPHLKKFATAHKLSRHEADLLRLSLRGVPRSHLTDELGVAESTVKSRVRAILRKTGFDRMSDVAWALRNRAS